MKNVLKNFFLMVLLVLGFTSFNIKPINAASNTIYLFNKNVCSSADYWTYTLTYSGNQFGTASKNSKTQSMTSNHSKAIISGKTLTITVTSTSNGTDTYYIYKNGDTSVTKTVTVHIVSAPTFTSISNSTNKVSSTGSVYMYDSKVSNTSTLTANVASSTGLSVSSYAWKQSSTTYFTSGSTSGKTNKITAVSGSVTSGKSSTVTCTATISSSGKRTTTISKKVTVYVYPVPVLNFYADGSSISKISLNANESTILTYTSKYLTGSGTKVTMTPYGSSSNYITVATYNLGGWKLTAKDNSSFPVGTTAQVSCTATIPQSNGDTVSSNNGAQTVTYYLNVTKVSISVTAASCPYYGTKIHVVKGTAYIKITNAISSSATFTCTSGNSSIFTISSCNNSNYNYCIKAVGTGTATLTVTSNGATQIFIVNVYDQISKLKASTVNMTNDQTSKISYTGLCFSDTYTNPTNYKSVSLYSSYVKYTSSNESVVKVQNGYLVPVSNGTATVTITYNYSNTANVVDKNGDTVSLNVTNPSTKFTVNVYSKITNLSFNNKTLSITKGKSKKNSLTASPTNEKTNPNFKWTSSNTAIATVNSKGTVNAKKVGTATITATATDGSGKSASYTVYVNLPKVTNIKSKNMKNSIKVYWKKVSGATSYKVYRSTSKNGSYSSIGSTTGNSYYDTSAAYGVTYYYKVVAESSISNNCSSAYSSATRQKHSLLQPVIKNVNPRVSKLSCTVTIKSTLYDGYIVYAGKSKTPKGISALITGNSSTIFFYKKGTYYVRVKGYKTVNGKMMYSKYSKSVKVELK